MSTKLGLSDRACTPSFCFSSRRELKLFTMRCSERVERSNLLAANETLKATEALGKSSQYPTASGELGDPNSSNSFFAKGGLQRWEQKRLEMHT